MKVTLLSDTHNYHNKLTQDIISGDLIIHAGDISSMGYTHQINNFAKWYNKLDFDFKVFIAGNHDWGFQNDLKSVQGELTAFKYIEYIQDDSILISPDEDTDIKIWGTPWQPEFCNWAFNLPRNGKELQAKWDMIPDDIDILVTHGPPHGILDDVEGRRGQHLGCELLREKVNQIKPKIHVFGHIHSGYGYYYDGHTHFFNAAVLDEQYKYTHKLWQFDWDPTTNEIKF